MKKILLVEDNLYLKSLMVKELGGLGYEVQTASNAFEAESLLNKRSQNEPDVIFMDIHVATADGLDMVGRILKVGMDKPLIIHSPALGYNFHPLTMASDISILEYQELLRVSSRLKKLLTIEKNTCSRTQRPN